MIRAHKTLAISIAVALLVAGGAFFLGLYVGVNKKTEVEKITTLVNKEPSIVFAQEQVDFDPFWKAWNLINEKFVTGNGTTTDQERVWGAIEGLVGSLKDPYSVFLPPTDAEIFQENINGNFGGVGMEIGLRDDILTVVAPLKGTPAERAGILSGDQIVAIDGKDTSDMKVDEAVKIIRGEIGTTVVFKIARKGAEDFITKEVTRETITIPTIDT
ncbi:MAG TPA: PDZ domain-containing protein, partial [Candidatus Paceibacterota bacterium]